MRLKVNWGVSGGTSLPSGVRGRGTQRPFNSVFRCFFVLFLVTNHMAAASTRLFSLAFYQVEGQRSHMCGRQRDGLTGSGPVLSQLSVSRQTSGSCCNKTALSETRTSSVSHWASTSDRKNSSLTPEVPQSETHRPSTNTSETRPGPLQSGLETKTNLQHDNAALENQLDNKGHLVVVTSCLWCWWSPRGGRISSPALPLLKTHIKKQKPEQKSSGCVSERLKWRLFQDVLAGIRSAPQAHGKVAALGRQQQVRFFLQV